MNHSPYALLDQNELLQLAINASQADNGGAAIAYLKEAVGRADANAIAHYLLGAEYAQIQMYERAIDEMEAALALDPALITARLQLGLLQLGQNAAERALAVFAPLQELDPAHPFALFGRGLSLLAGDQLAAASACLQDGIVANNINPALNGDMQKIVDEIAATLAKNAAAGAPVEDAEPADRHIFLSAYTGNTSH
jgi:tetratricopeptide (TPR) repeat protein